MNAFIILTALLTVIQALPLSEVEEQQWENFKLVYGKTYESEDEENMRKEIFTQKLQKFREHNNKYEAGLVSHTVGVNQFADMTHEEFVKTLTPMDLTEAPRGLPFLPPADVEVPSSIDWRDKGAVTAVRDQGFCESCYTYSATGALEGQFFIKNNKLVPLSVQNLIDCSSAYNNKGCKGGYPSSCFEYVQKNGGIDTEDSYPYVGYAGQCSYKPQNSGGANSGFVTLPHNDENALLTAVGTIGPVSIIFNADGLANYTGGVISGHCDPTVINHAVLVVGYNTTDKGQDYWIVKNSWGKGFGQDGYFFLARNKNQCGVAQWPTYPVV